MMVFEEGCVFHGKGNFNAAPTFGVIFFKSAVPLLVNLLAMSQ